MATPTTRRHLATTAAVASAALAAAVAVLLSGFSAPRIASPTSWLLSRLMLSTTSGKAGWRACPEIIDMAATGSLQASFSELNWGSADACQLFSDSYEEARDRFRAAARQVPGARLVSLPVVVAESNEKRKDDATYTMDLVVLPGTTTTGGTKPRLVVHTSGVHGVEGYAGSAVQVAFLQLLENRKWFDGGGSTETTGDRDSANSVLSRPTVVLVHAFNPFGMAHFRRVNENNVDLNRNGIRNFGNLLSPESHASQNRKNAYEQFRDLFSPHVSPAIPFGRLCLRQWLLFAWEAIRHGIPKLKAAMVSGQYHDPLGIFYGGDRVQPSYTVLERWLVQDLLPSVSVPTADTDRPFQSVTWIDVHTGLGPSGVDTILPCLPKDRDSTGLSKIWERFPDSHHPSSSATGASVAFGYGTVLGQVGDYFGDLLRPMATEGDAAMFVVQEFGTIVSPRVGHALIVENAAWHSAQQQSSSQWLRHAFYPDDPRWRQEIVTRGLRVLLQGMSA